MEYRDRELADRENVHIALKYRFFHLASRLQLDLRPSVLSYKNCGNCRIVHRAHLIGKRVRYLFYPQINCYPLTPKAAGAKF